VNFPAGQTSQTFSIYASPDLHSQKLRLISKLEIFEDTTDLSFSIQKAFVIIWNFTSDDPGIASNMTLSKLTLPFKNVADEVP